MLLPAMVQQLRREHPGVDIRLFEEEDNDAGAQAVLAGELDLAFTIGHRSGNLESMLLLDDPFVLVAPKRRAARRPLPDRRTSTRCSLVGYPPSSCQADIERGLQVVGATPTFVFRTYDNGAQMAMVRAGMGWAVMPLLAVDTRDDGLDVRFMAPGAAAAPDLHGVAQGPHAVADRGTHGRARPRGRQAPPSAAHLGLT